MKAKNFFQQWMVEEEKMMRHVQWNPWHGCHKCSPGCQNCYVYYLDSLHGKDANVVTKSKTNFHLPLKKDRQGQYKIPPGYQLATCFTSDFFIEEADAWREEAWSMIHARSDVQFLICTKRIARFHQCIPTDWGEGYENVTLAVTCENQAMANERLPLLLEARLKHKYVFAAPILEEIDFRPFLKTREIELVSVGGESYENARVCHFDWIKRIKKDCDQYQIAFDFHQTGANFLMNGKVYHIQHRDEYAQARKGMDYLERFKE